MTQEDLDAFKNLVDIIKSDAVLIATALVEAGVATWKPGMEPGAGLYYIWDVQHLGLGGEPRISGFGRFSSRDAAKKFLDGFINKDLAEGYVIRKGTEEGPCFTQTNA